ncbi:head-tail connector protein [Hyphomicrobium sp.]|uniref:head-tail connector protein n=1 Tax=Hyphomicrobium sp. TaxID=82 RepID=UPI002D77454C|nr:head-tail connector protein [Hyphomicrobium sp.]HET6390789.1 head-tail connector protein [Hyphomicrobium sp.]
MSLVMTMPPAVEPVSVADAKAHMRIDGDDEDVLIASLLLTSRLHIEVALSLALVTQKWKLTLDRWPRGRDVELPLSPLRSIDEIRVKDAAGVASVVPAESYLVDIASRPPRLVWNNQVPPSPQVRANGIEIEITAGFGASAESVPAPLKHAILMLTAHWYEHRDPGEVGSSDARIPEAVSALINPFRTIRL